MQKKHLIYIGLLFLAVLVILIGVFVANPFEAEEKQPEPVPKVGVIEINRPILVEEDREYVDNMIDYARNNESIESVVLKINCPGGYATAIEDIYYNLISLKKNKPIVTSVVGLAASGGYYISVIGDPIYAPPSAYVGNVGVKAISPTYPPVSEELLETGPYKRTGVSIKRYPKTIEAIFQSFLNSVENQRDETLTVPLKKIKTGSIFVGKRAENYGLIDKMGSLRSAVQKSADIAGIENYEVVEINEKVKTPSWWKMGTIRLSAADSENVQYKELSELTLSDLRELSSRRRHYLLYSPSLKSSESEFEGPSSDVSGSDNKSQVYENTVLVDYAHRNAFDPTELNVLLSKLTERGFDLKYLERSEDLKEELSKSSSFLVITPRESFTNRGTEAVENFLVKGGHVMLINDPSRTDPHAINTLSSAFGQIFASGYLYSLESNYGIYKNIYLNQFKDEEIVDDINRLVFFTASHILSKKGGVATSINGLYNSRGETKSDFNPIAVVKGGKVVSIGDFSFMKRPYSNLANNSRFISNIADFLGTERKIAEKSADFNLSNLKISPSRAKPGENVTISVDVKNKDEAKGTKNVSLRVNEEILEEREVTLAPGKSKTLTFIIVRENPGIYKVEIDGLSDNFKIVGVRESKYRTYTNENYEFKFPYLDNWEIEEKTIDNNISIKVNPPSKIQERAIGAITAGDLKFTLENVRKQLETFREILENNYPEENIVELKGPENIERNQVPGVDFRYLIKNVGYERMIFLERERFKYSLVLRAKMDVYENIENHLTVMAENFKPI